MGSCNKNIQTPQKPNSTNWQPRSSEPFLTTNDKNSTENARRWKKTMPQMETRRIDPLKLWDRNWPRSPTKLNKSFYLPFFLRVLTTKITFSVMSFISSAALMYRFEL